VIDINREIQELEQGKTYKYLGIEESEGIQQQMREILEKKYSRRLRMVLKSELNAKNKITAIAAVADLVLRYRFDTINRKIEEIKKN
jgi:limonene-1,2-epoxide hydrolase